ncbi:hypothetical protein AB0K93_03365 [Streptomyces sp. NPDC052676]|uniref:hypothetical protein n=1 Tax=Streptomyces sp. NPDC052676 TaxID=3154953 RepID=UPI0034266E13
MPDERHQLLLAHLYARTPGGDLALGVGSDFAQYLEALGLLGESERRIAELRTTVLRAATDTGGSMLALLAPGVHASLAAALHNPARTDEQALPDSPPSLPTSTPRSARCRWCGSNCCSLQQWRLLGAS